ncbi:tyrosine-type recombinase/integrase [Lachnospiraceae bacterium 56-18]|jgi:integrase
MLREIRKRLMSENKKQLKKGFWSVEVDGFKGFIFVTQRKNPYTSEVLNHAIKRICADYNKEEKKNAKRDGREPVLIRNFTCHNIRHTFATRICENETNLKAIQDIMGHKDNDEYIRRSNEGGKTKINGQLGG